MTQPQPRGADHPRSVSASYRRLIDIGRIAEIAIRDCAGIRPGEKVVIVNDNAGDAEFAALLLAFARDAGAEAVGVTFEFAPTIEKMIANVQKLDTSKVDKAALASMGGAPAGESDE